MFYLYISIYHMPDWCVQRPEENVRFPWTEVTNSCESQMWVHGIKLRSSKRVTSAFNCWLIPVVPVRILLTIFSMPLEWDSFPSMHITLRFSLFGVLHVLEFPLVFYYYFISVLVVLFQFFHRVFKLQIFCHLDSFYYWTSQWVSFLVSILLFIFMDMGVLLACMFVHHAHAVTSEARRKQHSYG